MTPFALLAFSILCVRTESGWRCPENDSDHETQSPDSGVLLRGRRMLTDRESVPLTIPYADLKKFPRLFSCSQNESASDSLVDLLKPLIESSPKANDRNVPNTFNIFQSSGAILVRGLPFTNSSGLSEFLDHLNVSTMPYTGGTAGRDELAKGVFNTGADHPSVTIEPHWEMSYAPVFPHIVFFFCHRRPAAKFNGEGLTPITDGRAVLQTLRQMGIAQIFEQRGVLYRFYYPSKFDESPFSIFSWEQQFRTVNKEEVESFLAGLKRDYLSLQWSWVQTSPGGPLALEYSFRTEAMVQHPNSPGEQVWFNQITAIHRSYWHAHANFPDLLDVPVPFVGDSGEACHRRYPIDTSYGDGGEIPKEIIRTLRQVYWNHTVVFQWEEGDLLMLDNMVAAHGRMDYDPTIMTRELFVSLLTVA